MGTCSAAVGANRYERTLRKFFGWVVGVRASPVAVAAQRGAEVARSIVRLLTSASTSDAAAGAPEQTSAIQL